MTYNSFCKLLENIKNLWQALLACHAKGGDLFLLFHPFSNVIMVQYRQKFGYFLFLQECYRKYDMSIETLNIVQWSVLWFLSIIIIIYLWLEYIQGVIKVLLYAKKWPLIRIFFVALKFSEPTLESGSRGHLNILFRIKVFWANFGKRFK